MVDELYRYYQAGYQVGLPKVADALHQVIRQHASVNHGSDVAWAIWGCLLFKIPLDDSNSRSSGPDGGFCRSSLGIGREGEGTHK